MKLQNRSSSLYTETGLMTGHSTSHGLIPGREKWFFSLSKRPDRPWDLPNFILNMEEAVFYGVKLAGVWSVFTWSSAEIKNDRSCTSTSAYIFMAYTGSAFFNLFYHVGGQTLGLNDRLWKAENLSRSIIVHDVLLLGQLGTEMWECILTSNI